MLARRPAALFLKQFTWVDLRDGLTEEGLDRLQWGVTGKKPRKRKRSPPRWGPSNAPRLG